MDHLISELGGSASTFGRQAVHQVRSNILPRVERELRENIVPTLERKGKEIKERWNEEQHPQRVGMKRRRRRPRPPSNTDIVYLTERFLVSSKPAVDRSSNDGPSFFDTGRDISSREAEKAAGGTKSKSRHDRIFRQKRNPSRSKQTGSNNSIDTNFENPEENEPSASSIPEEEGHNIPIEDSASSEQEVRKLSENPQDGAATFFSPTQTITSSEEHVESTNGGEGPIIIDNRDDDVQSPKRKPSASPPSTNATTPLHEMETPVRTIPTSSFHSNKTDLVVNHKEDTDHSSTTDKTTFDEAETPLTKNVFSRVISNLDDAEKIGDGPPLIPSMPLPPSWPKAPSSKIGPGFEDSDTSVASFGTCRMDDDTFDATPEPQPDTHPKPTIKQPQHSSISASSSLPASIMNSPGNMVTYLDKVHGREKYLAVSLAKEKPDDRTLLLFRRQILPMGLSKRNGNHPCSQWSPCCVERSETPSIQHVLKICYAIHAFLHLDPNNVVLTYCDNGKTRTAIVAACYLRFSNLVEKTEDGFCHFLSTLRKQRKLLLEREKQRRKDMGPLLATAMDAMMEDYYDDDDYVGEEKKKNDLIVENIMQKIPPSLKLFFEQYDRVLQLGGFLNRKPLLLRAIMLQGVPVEDQPCIDIWDSSQKHVYTSHPPASTNTARNNKKPVSQWVDEEGFYRINIVLDGEFLVLCRFGGDPAQLSKEQHIHDPSKILFRYTNTTGFMSGGYPYELPAKNVDLMRLYADHLDDEDFLLTLLFEADWEHIEDDEYDFDTSVSIDARKLLGSTSSACGDRIWRSHEAEARDEGWRIIFENHCARPTDIDIESFRFFHRHPPLHHSDFISCPDHLIMLSLQLTNYDFQRAAALLLNSPVFSWWREDEDSSLSSPDAKSVELVTGLNIERRDRPLEVETNLKISDGTKKSFREIENEATKSILDILDSVDVSSDLNASDQNLVSRWKIDSPRDPSSFEEADRQNIHSSLDECRSISDHRSSLSTLCLKSTGYLIPSIMYPHLGDIARSFRICGKRATLERRNDTNSELRPLKKRKNYISKPRIPYFSNDRSSFLPPPSRHIPNAEHLFDRRNEELRIPIYNSQVEAAKELHSQLRHTGMTLDMLFELQTESRRWTGFPELNKNLNDAVTPDAAQKASVEEASEVVELISSMNREEKEKKEKEWQDAQKAEAEERRKNREQEKATEKEKVGKAAVEAGVDEVDQEVLLKDDPEYGKYFKMLKLGMPREQVLHAFQRDGKDPTILDLNPDKSLESQLPSTGGDEQDGVPLKDDPEYEKYFKMLKLGMPREQVLHAFQRDGKDPTILDLDPNQSLESQLSTANLGEEEELPLEEDPEYVKYFKMLKLGMPKEQVLHALKRDDKNPSILDLDPKKSLKSQEEKPKDSGDGIPLKDDPEYSKYFKMTKMGMPKEQVLHALKRDGKDPTVLDLDPNKSLTSQRQNDDGVPLKDDPLYSKYFKMEQVGLPRDAVKNALLRDGKDPSIIDLDPNKSLKSQIGGELEEKDTGIPMKDDPEYAKYLKMEKMGMPKDVVRNALIRDGKNPAIVDFDQNMSVEFQLKKLKFNSSEKPASKRKKKKKIRRKKIYWNPIDPKKIKDDSLWNIVRDAFAMGTLNYDQKEFDELFTESAEAGAKQKKQAPAKKEAKKVVQAIDPKRDMNGGIVLSRIKPDREKIAEFVDKMDHTKFNAIELKNLKEYLPTSEERKALQAYMSKGTGSEEKKEELFKDLSDTEKYMVTLMKVSDVDAKLHTMEFRDGFKNRFSDITSAVRTLNTACDELRTSEKFRKLMAMILTVVNQINTGGEGNLAMGFTLDALLKLNEAKAFDKKTSVLHYVVKLVMKNDESLLYFENDLGHVIPAESVPLDALTSDMKALQNELNEVVKIVTKDADMKEKLGDTPQLTLAELVEQKSIVQHLDETPKEVSKGSNLTGRTPMERFSMNAKVACEQAIESISNLEAKYVLVLGYFGEDEKMPTGDFFGTLRRFMSEWKKATKQVEKIERRKAKERKREAKRAAKAKKKAKGSKSSSRNKVGDKSATSSLPPSGNGIAAIAAEAARKSSEKLETDDTAVGIPPGGIAALAAEAALKKSKATQAEEQYSEQKAPAVGIAALAAEAALKKSKATQAEEQYSEQKAPAVGIAALAAEAALKKSKATQAEEMDEKSSVQEVSVVGNAALAAEAALETSEGTQAEETDEKPSEQEVPVVGNEAKKAEEMDEKPSAQEAPAAGNAALAVQAALKTSEATKAEEIDEKPSAQDMPGTGNATLAAEAVLKTSEATAEETDNKRCEQEAPVVGNAALAAQAELKTSEATKAEEKDEKRPAQEVSAVEIAALAAEAVLKTSEATAEEKDEKRSEQEETAVGIGAHIAQAVLEQSQAKKGEDKPVQQELSIGVNGVILGQSAVPTSNLSKGSSVSDEIPALIAQTTSEKQPSLGEMAELAAKAAVEISKKQATKGEKLRQNTDSVIFDNTKQDSTRNSENQREKESFPYGTAPFAGSNSPTGAMSPANVQTSLESTLESTPKRSPQNGVPLVSRADTVLSLSAQTVVENAIKVLPNGNGSTNLPSADVSSLAAQATSEMNSKQSPQNKASHHLPGEQQSSLTAEVMFKTTPEKKPHHLSRDTDSSPAAKASIEKTPEKSSSPSPAGSPLDAGVVLEETSNRSSTEKSPQAQLASEIISLAAQVISAEKAKKQSPHPKTPERSPGLATSSLSLMLGNANIPSPNRSPHRSPTNLMSSLVMALETAKQKEASKRKSRSPTLGSFFEKQSRPEVSRQEERNEILRQNYDDSSIARMAENLQKDQVHGNAWNQGGGIADYLGWANQAIKASDTESVRDFQTARDMVYDDQSTIATNMDDSTYATNMDDSTYATNMDDSTHATNFDDGTIATNFDDDASIGTAMTPGNDLGYSGGGGGQDYYNSEQYDNYIGSANDPYNYTAATHGLQNTYGDAVINMPLEFTQDQGINNGLSFGDEGFDGPGEYGTNAMMGGAGAYGTGLVGFGQDAGLGGFGMASPTTLGNTLQNNFTQSPIPGPPLGVGNANPNLSWGATATSHPNSNFGDHNRPWSNGPDISKNAKSGNTPPKEEGVVFRGWGDATKTPEQPKKKSWFWS